MNTPVTEKTLTRYGIPHYPQDSKGTILEHGTRVRMPAPSEKDSYHDADWIAIVQEIDDESGNLLVSDDDTGEYHEISAERVTAIKE